jgi:F-type H+-transporting ATPase subunit b
MGALGLNLWAFIVQLVAFAVFAWLFWKFALGPITRVLDQRQERVRESLEAAERMKVELAATAQRNEAALAEARQQAQQIVAQAREAGEATLLRAREDAGRQADEYLARAQATLQQETAQARLSLRQEVADLSVMAAERILRANLDPAAQQRLIEQTLAEAGVPAGGGNGTGAGAGNPAGAV